MTMMRLGLDDIASHVRTFLHDARAGATAIASAAVTVMTVGAAALITDHVWLVDQRDVIESATDAASVAATLEMHRQRVRNPDISDADLETALESVVERYVVLNFAHLPPKRLARAKASLVVEAKPDRTKGTVSVSVEADLGGTLFSRSLALLGHYAGPPAMRAGATVECATEVVEVVLAIDVTNSMTKSFGGARRLDVAVDAAEALLEVLYSGCSDADIAVGIVPWDRTVRLDAAMAGEWARNGWVDESRYDALPASARKTWAGCVGDRTHDASDPSSSGGLSLTPPRLGAFPAYFNPDTAALDPRIIDDAYAKLAAAFPRAVTDLGEAAIREQLRRSGDNHWGAPLRGGLPGETAGPNAKCTRVAMLPLTTERARVDARLASLAALRDRELWHGGTMAHVGATWGRRMLAASWRAVWGHAAHPVDPDAHTGRQVTKALVLLTDGENTADDRTDTLPGRLYARYDAAGKRIEFRCKRTAADCKPVRTGYASHYSAIGRFGAGRVEDGHRMAWARAKTRKRAAREALDLLMQHSCALARDKEGVSVYTVLMNDERSWTDKLLACSGSAESATDEARKRYRFIGTDPSAIKDAFREIGKQLVAVRRVG